MSNQRNPNTNNVGQHAADNIGSQPGNNELDIILGKKEAYLGSDPGLKEVISAEAGR